MTVAALWFPDWPVHAVRIEQDITGPVIVAAAYRVKVCSAEARAAGIRRGMKIRQAQALLPQVTVVEDDPGRNGRVFAPIADSLDDVASSVEVLRPGLVLVDAGAALRFHGPKATEMLVDSVARRGIDVFIGVAQEIATAIIAARSSTVVEDSATFLAAQPLRVLAAEEALGCDPAVVRSLAQLGVKTLGDLAGLPAGAVMTRFGQAGITCHRIASAAADRKVAPELLAPDLTVEIEPEEPIQRVDEAAFIARNLAARLHRRLQRKGLVCQRLEVSVELADATVLKRVWRTRDELTESATADRVRWQLDGWLSAGGSTRGILRLTLRPVEAHPPADQQLWGRSRSAERAHRAIERVQSALGIDAVLQPRAVGGRGVAERIDYVPYGESATPVKEASWPGKIPAPLPARLGGGPSHPAARIRLINAAAVDVYVTAEALLSSVPYALSWGKHRYRVVGWAGPWPVAGKWWAHQQQLARLQVLGDDERGHQRAWLLVWLDKGWRVEATYV